jgi:hypothetical protein
LLSASGAVLGVAKGASTAVGVLLAVSVAFQNIILRKFMGCPVGWMAVSMGSKKTVYPLETHLQTKGQALS